MTTATNLGVQAATRFRDPNNDVISAGQWLAYLNQAYGDVNTSTPLWPWLESSEQTLSLTAGNRSVSLPTNVFNVNWVYNTTDDERLIPQEGRGDQWTAGRVIRSTTGHLMRQKPALARFCSEVPSSARVTLSSLPALLPSAACTPL